jgi:hypothetical protein
MRLGPKSQKPSVLHMSWRAWLLLTTLGAFFLYLWILPLFKPRGDFLWGYYRLKDIYLGIPVGLAFLSALAAFAVPDRYKRRLVLRLASVSLSLMFALFVCDAVYALAVNGVWRANFWLDQGHISRRYSIADDELGFVRKPRVSWRGFVPEVNRVVDYRTDENGFRNPDGVGRAEVVFIGDSYTEAATVQEKDTFVHRVGVASKLSAVNLGRGAYGPQQELIVLQRYGLAYHPRVVIWQLFEGNDLNDARLFSDWRENPQREGVSFKDRYFENSLLSDWIPKRRRKVSEPLVKLRHSDGTENQITLRYPYDPDAALKDPVGFEETTKAIEQGYRLCQSQGIKLVVVSVPTMVRVMEPFILFDRAEAKTRYLPPGTGNKNSDFSGKMAEFCRTIGCQFIDAFATLRPAATVDTRDLYVPVDEHLEIRGHEVMAQTISEWLRTQAIVGEVK